MGWDESNWRTMMVQDEMRRTWEHNMQDAAGLHNQHVLAMHQRNYYTCYNAVNRAEQEMKLC